MLIAGVVVVLLGALVLEVLRFISERRGVSSVGLPVGSEVRRRATGADYTDAYSVQLGSALDLAEADFGMGQVVYRDSAETIWEGRAPGLRFLASSHVAPGFPGRFTLSTVVFYESVVGPVYFFPVRFFHRRGVPFMVSRLAS